MLTNALVKKDLESCKLTNLYLEHLEMKDNMIEVEGENKDLKKENKVLRERFGGATKDDDGDMFYYVMCDYAGKSEAGLKVHTGKKHKGSP